MEATLERIGEVVGADTRRFTVQCYRLYEAPPLGTLVRTGNPSVYAVVSEVSTESRTPCHRQRGRCGHRGGRVPRQPPA